MKLTHAVCLCGAKLPSRLHLLWQCPATEDLRRYMRQPQTRTEHRLLAVALDERPGPLQEVEGRDDVLSQLTSALLSDSVSSNTVYIATDGSAAEGVAAYAVVLPQLGLTVGTGLQGEEQTAFRSEVEALSIVLQAIETAFLRNCRTAKIVIVCDCQAAILLAEQGGGQRPLLARRVHEGTIRCRALVELQFQWVPSHGKQVPGWVTECEAPEGGVYPWFRAMS